MTKKIVIAIALCDEKCRSKALQIAVSLPGVQSAEIVIGDRHRVVVVGDIDSIELTWRLRKKVGHAELMSVNDAATANTQHAKPAVAAAAPVVSSNPSKKLI